MNVTVGRKYKGEKRMKNCLTIREHEAFTLILCGNDNNESCQKNGSISAQHTNGLLAGIYKHLGYKSKNDLLVAHLDKAVCTRADRSYVRTG